MDIRDRVIELRRVKASELVPNPKNWRKHPAHQRQALKEIVGRIGFAGAELVRVLEDGRLMLIDGHLRATTFDDAELPVLVTDLSEAEADAILATFDPIGAMAEADKKALEGLLTDVQAHFDGLGTLADEVAAAFDLPLAGDEGNAAGDPGAQVDRAEELLKKWQVKRGDVWHIGAHRLMCGDSTSADDVARLMAGEKAEMVWTDPPYGVAIGDKNKFLNAIAPSNRVEGNLTNDTLSEPDLRLMLEAAFDNAIKHCTAGAAWYVAAPAGPLHVIFGAVLKDRGIWRQTIQWVKNNATFSPMGVDYHWQAEPIFYGWVPDAGHRYYGGRQQTTVWNIDRPTKSSEHPTMKPVELVDRAINNSSLAGQAVLDLFNGSGTTLVACEQTGRRGYGMEIEPKYCAVTLERLAGMGLEPVRVEGGENAVYQKRDLGEG